MLKLSRKTKDSITIQTQEGTITISIEGIRGKQVKVGVDAPKSINVFRTEYYRHLAKTNSTSIVISYYRPETDTQKVLSEPTYFL